jgi:hypothetical protein
LGDKVKEGDMGWTHSMHEERNKNILLAEPEIKSHSEDLENT